MTVTTVIEEMMMTVLRKAMERIMTRMIVMMEMRMVITVWRTDPLTDNDTCSLGLGPQLGKSGLKQSKHYDCKPGHCQMTK